MAAGCPQPDLKRPSQRGKWRKVRMLRARKAGMSDQLTNHSRRQSAEGGVPTNKTELVAKVAERAGMSKKDADKAITAFVETVEEALTGGDKVSLVGFGTFEVRSRAARKGLNPQTKKEINIPASRVPAFKAGKALKDSVAK